ncbi:uncharacterized protein LOC144634249 [Oculina patagonica]
MFAVENVCLLFFLSATIWEVAQPAVDCQGKPNGNYKDPNNCHGYIACSNGNTHYKDCAPATPQLVYNEQTDQCVYPSELACWSDSVDCQDKPNGNYKDPDNCHGYIACSNGNTYYMDCAETTPALVYDEKTGWCVDPRVLACWSE